MIRHIKIICLFLVLLISCGKKENTNTVKYVLNQLNNSKTRTWQLKSLYVNGQSQTLTTAQTLYSKTYKSDGSWLDSDGYKGTYSVATTTSLKEITTNNVTGTSSIDYTIVMISSTLLTVEYTYNQVKYKYEFSS